MHKIIFYGFLGSFFIYNLCNVSLSMAANQYNSKATNELFQVVVLDGNRDFKKIEELVARGADVNVKDPYGRTLLHHCVLANPYYSKGFGLTNLIQSLVGCGADLGAQDDMHNTIMHFAVTTGDQSLLEYLASQPSFMIDVKNIHGKTSLHEAVRYGNFDSVIFLHEHGADINIQDFHGYTPLKIAKTTGLGTKEARIAIIKYLSDVQRVSRSIQTQDGSKAACAIEKESDPCYYLDDIKVEFKSCFLQ